MSRLLASVMAGSALAFAGAGGGAASENDAAKFSMIEGANSVSIIVAGTGDVTVSEDADGAVHIEQTGKGNQIRIIQGSSTEPEAE